MRGCRAEIAPRAASRCPGETCSQRSGARPRRRPWPLDEAVDVAFAVVLDRYGAGAPAVVVGAPQQFGELRGVVGGHVDGDRSRRVWPGAKHPVGEVAVLGAQSFRHCFPPDVRGVDGVLEVGMRVVGMAFPFRSVRASPRGTGRWRADRGRWLGAGRARPTRKGASGFAREGGCNAERRTAEQQCSRGRGWGLAGGYRGRRPSFTVAEELGASPSNPQPPNGELHDAHCSADFSPTAMCAPVSAPPTRWGAGPGRHRRGILAARVRHSGAEWEPSGVPGRWTDGEQGHEEAAGMDRRHHHRQVPAQRPRTWRRARSAGGCCGL